jgi:hypothetical protein
MVDEPDKRRPRAANASFWERAKQAADAQQSERILQRLASGLPLFPDQKRWLDKQDPSVRDAILACKQEDSRFLPTSYLREAQAEPLPRGATQADRDERLRHASPQAYRGQMRQREVAEDALAMAGVSEAVAAIAPAAGVPTGVPTTVETMRAALVTVDGHLIARACNLVDRQMPNAAQRADPLVLKQAWETVEQRAGRHLPELVAALKRRREKALNPPLTLEEQWGVLEQAALSVAFSEEVERVANEYHIPALAQHLRAMREALVEEHSARLVTVAQPGRVPGANAAWRALADSHGISVATLRQRGKQSLLTDPEDQEPLPPRPPRDRRQRGRR